MSILFNYLLVEVGNYINTTFEQMPAVKIVPDHYHRLLNQTKKNRDIF